MVKTKKDYHFAGWVTKNDIKCSDGVTIKQGAFKGNDGDKVPLVWNHNYDNPNNVLGHMILKHHNDGVYGYGYFNDTSEGESAKKLVTHGDITAMSMGARKVKRSGTDVVHGTIYEVSLVLAAANPGAMIESVITHGETGEEEVIVHTDYTIHSADDIIDTPDEEEIVHNDETTIDDVISTMTDIQKEAVYALLGAVAESKADDVNGEEETIDSEIDDKKGDDEKMKHNVFDKEKKDHTETLRHSINEALRNGVVGKVGSLKELLEDVLLQSATNAEGETLTHGINSIEMLFPEAAQSSNGNTPIIYKDPNTKYKAILNAVAKTPFANVRTLIADLTEDEARAKGYIKGNMKKEEFFSLLKRVTGPTTVYKKQKLDRDDIIDITDFDVVNFLRGEMRMMLEEEIARAILIGDGREVDSDDKIDETRIRPIISDHEFFTIHKAFESAATLVEDVLLAMKEYRGSGSPTMYIDPAVLIAVKLLKGTDGRYLTGHIPSTAELASMLGLGGIEDTSFMAGKGALIVNLRDYNLGASKGGQITNFDDFDIDFNQYKYLIETRLSGALVLPKSAIHLAPGSKGAAANDTKGGVTFGDRQADKVVPTVGD